jgi:cellulose synthase/poly-beta-1,6-N-acetylglucosamine synthase-like glycosyltransferase
MHMLFWTCAALLVMTFAGYPALVRLQARVQPRPLHPQPWTPMVSVVMAVHAPDAAMDRKVAALLALDWPPDRLEVVVFLDGGDAVAAGQGDADARVRVLAHPHRRGKAACLNDAVAAARGEVLLMVDVRQRVEAGALRALVACLSDPAVGAVSGELCFEDAETGFARSVDAYWRYEKAIRLAEGQSGSVIGVTGALYALRRALFQPIPEGTVLDDVLLPMQVVKAGARVVFEPQARAWDRPSQSPGQERARKVRTLAGNLQLLQLAPWLLDPRANPAWFRFACHKLLRLAAPWLTLGLVVATVVLASGHPFYLACLVALAGAAVLLALAAIWRPLARLRLVRLLSAFLHMNLYAAQAPFALARNSRLHLW